MLENYISKKRLLALWKKYHFRPNRRLGQNFLIDFSKVQKMIAALQINPQDTIYEIGPGFGALTCLLTQQAKKVIAVEKDKRLVSILRDFCSAYPNLMIIHDDILEFLKKKHPQGKFISNPPYYLTSPLIHRLLEISPRPLSIILTVQKEVGEKILAQPPKANRFAVAVQLTSHVEKIAVFSRQSFWPRPEVDSLLIRIQPLQGKPLSQETLDFLNQGFAAPRKTLLNNLKSQFPLEKEEIRKIFSRLGLSPQARPGNLRLEDWKQVRQRLLKGKTHFQRTKNPL